MTIPARTDDQKDSTQLFLKAADLTDIRSPDSPPFELDAKVEIWGFDGKPIPGGYSLVWVSPSQWREELSFSGYSRTRVGGEERYWQQRSLDYEPTQISELSEAVDFTSSLRGAKSPGKLKSRRESGAAFDCTHSGNDLNEEYCFETSQGVLVLEKTRGETGELLSFRYSDFQVFGQKRFPGTIQVTAGQTALAEFSVTRLVNIENTALSDLAPPNGASVWPTCPNPQRPRVISQAQPLYPLIERTAHHQGNVVMYAIVAADGSVQNVKVLEAPSAALGDSAAAAVRQWRYEPRRCGDTPAPTELLLHVIFTLGSN
jgi:TonB family protein